MTKAEERINKVKQNAGEKIKAIQGNHDLTMLAKGKQIGAIRVPANAEINKLKVSHFKEQADRRDSMYRGLFGLGYPPSATPVEKEIMQMNYRDALFKADSITSQTEALRALGRARMVGDRQLAKAIARVAFEQQWDAALSEYASESETVQTKIQELIDFERGLGNNQTRMTESMSFSLIPETQEEIQARLSGQSVGG